MKKLFSACLMLTTVIAIQIAPNAFAATANGALVYEELDPVNNNYVIYRVNADGTERGALTSGSNHSQKAEWSPDNTKIAFLASIGGPVSGSFGDIYTMDPLGGNKTMLVDIDSDEYVHNLSWSSDGSVIVYESRKPNADPAHTDSFVKTVDVSNSSVSTIATATDQFFNKPVFKTGDNNTILYADTNGNLTTMDSSGGNVTTLVNGTNVSGEGLYAPRYYAEGTKIVAEEHFVVNSQSVVRLVTFDANGSNRQILTNNTTYNVSRPTVSPDSKYVAYVSSQGGQKIVVQNLTDGTTEDVVDQQSPFLPNWGGKYVTSVATDPDGRTINTITDNLSSTNYAVTDHETLVLDGQLANTTVNAGGILKGTGNAGALTLSLGGLLAPGQSPGCITSGNTNLAGTFQVELGGTTPCSGYDQLIISSGGTVVLNNPILDLSRYNNFEPALNDTFTIINNTSSTSYTGTFTGLAEGATITLNGYTFTISYVGGDGNDVVLTVTAVAPNAPTPAPQVPSATNGTGVAAPATPNTGLALITANPLLTLISTLVSACVLFVTARKYGSITS